MNCTEHRNKRFVPFISFIIALSLFASLLPVCVQSFVIKKTCRGFVINTKSLIPAPQSRDLKPIFAIGSEGENDINGSDKPLPCNKNLHGRCADYPSFAYQKNTVPSNRRQKSVSFRVRRDDGVGLSGNGDKTDSTKKAKESSTKRANILKDLNWMEPSFTVIAKSAARTRFISERSYAKKGPFEPANITVPPSLEDMATPNPSKPETFWISTPARLLSFAGGYLVFPYLTEFLNGFVTMDPAQLDEITSKFGPGVSILYGTFVSLTLSILYNRQQAIQTSVATETSLLSTLASNLLTVFSEDRDKAIEAGQCVADQVRTLVSGSRGGELLRIMYTDPYSRILELIDRQELELREQRGDLGGFGNILGSCRDILKDLTKSRACRLSDESLALPPTHFFVLTSLTILIFLGYTVSILPTVPPGGAPSNESSFLFGALCAIYVLFYNFAYDLNNPFQGVYQVRRSSAAAHLLHIKFLLAYHPLLEGEIEFAAVEQEPGTSVKIRSPGLGDLWFEQADIFPDPAPENNSEPVENEHNVP